MGSDTDSIATFTGGLEEDNFALSFELILESGKSIFIIASELKDSEDGYYSQIDNLLVTTNFELLEKLENIEQSQIQKNQSKKTIWKKLFGHYTK